MKSPAGRSLLRRGLAFAMPVFILFSLLVVAAPAGLSGTAGASGTDAAAFVLESLSDTANSWQCQQNPAATGCLGALGDLLRLFPTTAMSNHAEVMRQLQSMSADLAKLVRDTQNIQNQVDKIRFDQKRTELNASGISSTLKEFNEVTEACQKVEQPFKEGSYCYNWYGARSGSVNSTLVSHIYGIVSKGGYAALDAVSGSGTYDDGAMGALAQVVSDQASAHFFFTKADSNNLLNTVSSFIDAELGYLTLWTNYESIASPNATAYAETVDPVIAAYKAGIVNQRRQYRPLPADTSYDMRTGLMWSTDNHCVRNSLEPPTCGISTIGGFRLDAHCPPYGKGCALYAPFNPPTVSAGEEALMSTRDALPFSSWKVPSQEDLRNLMRDHGSNGIEFLNKRAAIFTSSEYALTSTLWCSYWLSSNASRDHAVCMPDGSGHGDWSVKGPFRVIMNLKTGQDRDVPADNCNNGPCSAGYMFVRQVPDAPSYGILRRN